MSFLILDPDYHNIAVLGKQELINRYNLKAPLIEKPIASSIGWRPVFLWNRQTEYLAVEVADRPMPPSIYNNFLDIYSSGLPIRMIVIYPHNNALSTTEYQKDVAKARKNGIGLLAVDEATSSVYFEYKGISSVLAIPSIDLSALNANIRANVHDAYDTYMNGDPKHGVQEVGQMIEMYMRSLAKQAIAKHKFPHTAFIPGQFYKLTKLIDELIADKVIDAGILGNCRGFVYPRNDTSHPAESINEVKKIEKKYKENFLLGYTILEQLPERFKEKGYKFKK